MNMYFFTLFAFTFGIGCVAPTLAATYTTSNKTAPTKNTESRLNKLPDIWWRSFEMEFVNNFAIDEECNSTAICKEIYIITQPIKIVRDRPTKYLLSFFGGKKKEIFSEEVMSGGVTKISFIDGTQMNLWVLEPTMDAIDEEKGYDELVGKGKQVTPRPALRLRSLPGEVAYKEYLDCVSPLHGLEAVDSTDKVLWRRLIVGYGLLARKNDPLGLITRGNSYPPYGDECYTPNQYRISSAARSSLVLNDGTVILAINGIGAVRIYADGRAGKLPPNVKVYEFDDVTKLKVQLYKKNKGEWVFSDTAERKTESKINTKFFSPAMPKPERDLHITAKKLEPYRAFDPWLASNFMVLQYYLFPELLEKLHFTKPQLINK